MTGCSFGLLNDLIGNSEFCLVCCITVPFKCRDLLNSTIYPNLDPNVRCQFQTLQKRISERAPHDRKSSTNGIARALLVQARVHFDQIQGDQRSSFRNALADEVTLAESQSTSYSRSCAGRVHGVQRVNVEGQMDGCIAADPAQSHVHDLSNAMPIPPSVKTPRNFPNQLTCPHHAWRTP
jgi:hypothetical protein